MDKPLEATIKRVGDKYKAAPRPLKITVGKILEGTLKIIRK